MCLQIVLTASREQREHAIFHSLLSLSPGLDDRILKASADELHYVADMVRVSGFEHPGQL